MEKIVIVCVFVFMAGFIDSIAGGGGLISLPAYYAAGLPPHLAAGSNKFSSTPGILVSTIRFYKNKKIHMLAAAVSVVFALIGSACGAKLALFLDEKYLRMVMIVLVPLVAVFIYTRKGFGEEDASKHEDNKKIALLSGAIGFALGAYDGFFGPGTGTFLMLLFTTVLGFDIVTASGNTKAVNLASNFGALATFMLSGKVAYHLAIPAAICCIAGNFIGSGLAIKKGAKIIKPIFIVVMVLLFAKIITDSVIYYL